jgi:LmbE family N-acetylglucosaminyl deacetylase
MYAIFAVSVLFGTTILWAYLSARTQQSNADQLVDPLFFKDWGTFQQALFPGAHSFFLKWPLFWLVSLLGYPAWAFIGLTIVIALATVGALAFILRYIEKRNLIFGTVCLALAAMLLATPTAPYTGLLLPLNMAMLATRNLEYILYIGSLWLMLRALSLRHPQFWVGVLCMAILIASDKLFLALSAGGAFAALIAYAIAGKWNLVSLAVRWLIGGLAATAIATVIFWIVGALRLTNIVGDLDAGPYGLVHGLQDVAKAGKYLLLGLLSNFGINTTSFGADSIASLINALVLGGSLFGAYRLVYASFTRGKNKRFVTDDPARLSIMLLWSTLAACAVFVATNHYYPVDARYLAIAFFAVVIAGAVYLRKILVKPMLAATVGAVLFVGIVVGIFVAVANYNANSKAFAEVNSRNALVAKALSNHHVDILVGDYWRVVPIKVNERTNAGILPLASCTQTRNALSSKSWEQDLGTHSFAYLLSFDKSLTDFPGCTLQDVVKEYGSPNASVVISGDIKNPKELLLYYDKGKHSSPASTTATPATVVPITPEELPYTSCPVPTIMNVVAHQDDDLLFMNPDLLHDIHAGHCIRTVYVTAGDAGGKEFYWQSREQGAEAAYDQMLGSKEVWVQRIVAINEHSYVTVANPKGNPQISLIFLHLPDGGLTGEGFMTSQHETIPKLESGKIATIHSVYGTSAYTSPELVSALSTIMSLYRPSEIRSQANYPGLTKSPHQDHSDHMAVGRYVQRAYHEFEAKQYEGQLTIPLKFYIGYPIRDMPQNVTQLDLHQKTEAFLQYAKFDGGVCQTAETCSKMPTYGSYLSRQYQNPQ